MHGKIAFFKQNSFAIFCRDKCKIPWVQDRIWVIINVMERVEIKAGTDKKCNSLDFTQRASLFRYDWLHVHERGKNQFTYVHINGHMKLIEALLGLIKKVFHISGKNLVGAITAKQSAFFA